MGIPSKLNNVEVAESVKGYEDGDAGEQEGTASES